MTTIVLQTEHATDVSIPMGIDTLAQFRRWAYSSRFPTEGRIDYVNGSIEVDMSPEDLFTHGTPKVELLRALANRMLEDDRGMVLGDRMRVAAPEAELSVEPDVVFVSHASLEDGRVTIRPGRKGTRDSGVELIGAVDLVVEILSPGSIKKDTQLLPKAYYAAGVTEYWIVDALQDELRFQVYGRGSRGFIARRSEAEGWQKSTVFDTRVKFTRTRTTRGYQSYRFWFESPGTPASGPNESH